MKRAVVVLLLAAVATGGVYGYFHYQVEVRRGDDGKVQSIVIVPRIDQGAGPAPVGAVSGAVQPPIRIATWNLGGLDERKLSNRRVADVITRTLPRFDLLALQDLRPLNWGMLLQMTDLVNADGQQYDFAILSMLPQESAVQIGAFVFNKKTIEIDRLTVREVSVKDPKQRFLYPPLVAQFRVRGPAQNLAFTFKLINVHVAPQRASEELMLLDDVYRAVRDDGSSEDDVILLGSFGAQSDLLATLASFADVTAVIAGTPTSVLGAQSTDNVLFGARATSEFTGRAGVFDMMREFGLDAQEARLVSEHLPVWAEFSAYEGGQSGHVPVVTAKSMK